MKDLLTRHGSEDRWFYLFCIPLAWAGCSLLHWQHPGNEYAMYFISSIAGSWIWFLIPVGDIHNPLIPLSVAVVGALVLVGVGWGLLRLEVRKATWAGMLGASALAILVLALGSFPSIDRALAKNGSWVAYICSSILMATYAATPLSLFLTGIHRLWRRRRLIGRGHQPSPR